MLQPQFALAFLDFVDRRKTGRTVAVSTSVLRRLGHRTLRGAERDELLVQFHRAGELLRRQQRANPDRHRQEQIVDLLFQRRGFLRQRGELRLGDLDIAYQQLLEFKGHNM